MFQTRFFQESGKTNSQDHVTDDSKAEFESHFLPEGKPESLYITILKHVTLGTRLLI